MAKCRGRLNFASLVLPVFAVLAACSGSGLGSSASEVALALRADLTGAPVAMVVVQVTAPDIVPPLVFNMTISNGVASGTITAPAGSSRTITVRAYDAGGVLTHSGSATVALVSGTNPTLSITLTPLTGDLPITATLGTFVITVTPAAPNLGLPGNSVGNPATAPLTATIKDSQGNLVSGTVTWATLNPGVASVDGNGVVTATGNGTTTIAAVYRGVSGTAAVTVVP